MGQSFLLPPIYLQSPVPKNFNTTASLLPLYELSVILDQAAGLAFRLDQVHLTRSATGAPQADFASWPITSIASSMCSRTLALSQLAWRSMSKAAPSSSSNVTGSKTRRSRPSRS